MNHQKTISDKFSAAAAEADATTVFLRNLPSELANASENDARDFAQRISNDMTSQDTAISVPAVRSFSIIAEQKPELVDETSVRNLATAIAYGNLPQATYNTADRTLSTIFGNTPEFEAVAMAVFQDSYAKTFEKMAPAAA